MTLDRVGQKGRICHRWWLKGLRPPGLCDRRFEWAYLFAAVRPATGDSSALVLPLVSTEAMSVFLDHFAAGLAPDEHAVMVLDQAGWHGARALRIPDNVSLVPLPPYAPELNPIERVWLYLRERFLSHRLLGGYEAIVDACCSAWNRLTPDRLRSPCNYPYIQQVNVQARRYESEPQLSGISRNGRDRLLRAERHAGDLRLASPERANLRTGRNFANSVRPFDGV